MTLSWQKADFNLQKIVNNSKRDISQAMLQEMFSKKTKSSSKEFKS